MCSCCPLQLDIRSSSQASMDMALHMSTDLLNKVAEAYMHWCLDSNLAVFTKPEPGELDTPSPRRLWLSS